MIHTSTHDFQQQPEPPPPLSSTTGQPVVTPTHVTFLHEPVNSFYGLGLGHEHPQVQTSQFVVDVVSEQNCPNVQCTNPLNITENYVHTDTSVPCPQTNPFLSFTPDSFTHDTTMQISSFDFMIEQEFQPNNIQVNTEDFPYSTLIQLNNVIDNQASRGILEDDVLTTTENIVSQTIENNTHIEYQQTLDTVKETLFPNSTMVDYLESGRRNSADSSGDDSMSSEKTFNSAYTDTVSSVHSTDMLLKPDSDSDEDAVRFEFEPVKEIYFNSAYESYSISDAVQIDSKTEEDKDQRTEFEESDITWLKEANASEISEQEIRHETKAPEDPAVELTNDALQDFIHHLTPIAENEVSSFTINEVEPTPFTKITNNIMVVDESFLFLSQNSLSETDFEKRDKRSTTMNNLHERSSFLDLTEISKVGRACQKALIYLKDDMNFGSLASINTIANKGMENDPMQSVSLIDGHKVIDIVPSKRHTRNLVALSLCITFLYIAVGSVRNLQSSINHEGGVGVISMAVSYVGYMGGSIVSVPVVQNFQPRLCIIINIIPNLMYVAANIYPVMWLMVPISFIQGVSMAIIWNAMSTYVTFLARGRAQKKNEKLELVSGRFFGIFCLIYQSYLIIGNLIASLVLMSASSGATAALAPINITTTMNSTINHTVTALSSQTDQYQSNMYLPEIVMPLPVELNMNAMLPQTMQNLSLHDVKHLHLCGAEFCQHFELGGEGFAVSAETKYLLFGIFMGCTVLSLLIAVFILEPLNTKLFSSTVSPVQKIKSQLLSMAKFSINRDFLLLLPLLMYSVMQFGFVSAEVTMAFITCPLGIHMVGYTMICFGVCGSISSYLSGLLNKFTGRIPPILFAAVLNLGALISMIWWKPNLDSLILYFIMMGIWGIGDGIWMSQVNSLMGNVFPDKYEEAYAGLRVAQGLGVAISFGYSNSLCMALKIYILGAICVLSISGYLLMEFLLRKRQKSKLVTLKQTSV